MEPLLAFHRSRFPPAGADAELRFGYYHPSGIPLAEAAFVWQGGSVSLVADCTAWGMLAEEGLTVLDALERRGGRVVPTPARVAEVLVSLEWEDRG